MCVCVCLRVLMCVYAHVSWCVNGNQENSGISFLPPIIQVLNGELRLLGLLAGAFLLNHWASPRSMCLKCMIFFIGVLGIESGPYTC